MTLFERRTSDRGLPGSAVFARTLGVPAPTFLPALMVLAVFASLVAWAPWSILAGLVGLAVLCAILVWPALGLALAAVSVPFGAWAPVPLPGGGGSLTAAPLLLLWTALAVAGRALASDGLGAGTITAAGGRPRSVATDDGGSEASGVETNEARTGRALWRNARPIGIGLTLYLLVLAASGWWAPSIGAVLVESARWVELGLAIALAAWLGRNRTGRRTILIGLLLAASAEACFGAYRSLNAVGPEAFGILGGRLSRAYGSFGQPNPFGGYMNMAWPLGAALLATWWLPARGGRGGGRVTGVPKVAALEGAKGPDDSTGYGSPFRTLGPLGPFGPIGLVAAGICGAGLVLSWSRGAWLAAVAAAGAMAIALLLRAWRGREARTGIAAYLALTAVVGLAAFGLLPSAPASITARLATIARGPALAADVAEAEVTDASFATVERLAHWAAAGSMWSERPWLGQGPGHYELAYAAHRLPRWSEPLGHAHNDYLQALAETGLLGLLAWLALLAALLWTCLRAALDPREAWRAALGLGALGVWAATATHGLFDRLYVHDMTIHLGLLTGLVLATYGPPHEEIDP